MPCLVSSFRDGPTAIPEGGKGNAMEVYLKHPISKTAARKKRGKRIANWQKVKAKRLKRMESIYGMSTADKPRPL